MLKNIFNNKYDDNDLERENPMNGVSNMSDSMLVLTVGVMLKVESRFTDCR